MSSTGHTAQTGRLGPALPFQGSQELSWASHAGSGLQSSVLFERTACQVILTGLVCDYCIGQCRKLDRKRIEVQHRLSSIEVRKRSALDAEPLVELYDRSMFLNCSMEIEFRVLQSHSAIWMSEAGHFYTLRGSQDCLLIANLPLIHLVRARGGSSKFRCPRDSS